MSQSTHMFMDIYLKFNPYKKKEDWSQKIDSMHLAVHVYKMKDKSRKEIPIFWKKFTLNLILSKIFNILWLFTICKFVCLPTNVVFPKCLLILSNLFCYSHPHELNLIWIIYSKWFWHVLTPVTCSSVNTFSTCLPGKKRIQNILTKGYEFWPEYLIFLTN